jgi:hypothetical protein
MVHISKALELALLTIKFPHIQNPNQNFKIKDP